MSIVFDPVERRKEQKRLAAAKWRANHPARHKEVMARYREKNKNAILEKNRRDLERNRIEKPQACMFYSAKRRAKQRGFPFEISIEDVVIPDVCPVLGLSLIVGAGSGAPNSPTLDKIIPCLGYIKGNVQVISRKANTMKSDASFDELRRFAVWVNRVIP